MLTDSNEDSLLARIERRGEERRAWSSTIPLKTSYQSLCVYAHTHTHTHTHTHVHTEIQTTQAHTKKNKFDVYWVDQSNHWAVLYQSYFALLRNLYIENLYIYRELIQLLSIRKMQQFCDFLLSHWRTAGL